MLFHASFKVSIPCAHRDIEITVGFDDFINRIDELENKINNLELECSAFPGNIFCAQFQEFLNKHFENLMDGKNALEQLRRSKRAFGPNLIAPFHLTINTIQNINPEYMQILNESINIQYKTISNLTEVIGQINKRLEIIEWNEKNLQLNDMFQFYTTIILDYTNILNSIFNIF